MISNFKIFPILLFTQVNFDIVGLSLESCLAICHPHVAAYKPVAYLKKCISDTGYPIQEFGRKCANSYFCIFRQYKTYRILNWNTFFQIVI